MDNPYIATHLLILLREMYQILAAGTTRAKQIGWPKDQIILLK